MKRSLLPLVIIGSLVGVFLIAGSLYTVSEGEQILVTQFGSPRGEPVTEAGIHFKVPLIQDVVRIEKRAIEWDGGPNEMPTKDKTYIMVDSFARWRIIDAKQYYLRLREERSAQSRLDDILGSETRNTIAKHELIEVIRSTKDRKAAKDSTLEDLPGTIGLLYPITRGREQLEEEILKNAAEKLRGFGIELLDVRFKRINYNASVQNRIFSRMISERQQIAERFRSEGAGEVKRNAICWRLNRKHTGQYKRFAARLMQKLPKSMPKHLTRTRNPSSFMSSLRRWKVTPTCWTKTAC
jgi:modulator of FtsH protease HflC